MADLPDRRRKKDRKHHRKGASNHASTNGMDEEFDSNDDNYSVVSEADSVDSQFALEDIDEGVDYMEDFEGKLKENIEGCRQKGSNGRQASLLEVQKALRRRYAGEFLTDRVETMIDILEKLMKRGTGRDRVLGSAVACLFCLQVGEDDSTKLFDAMKPILLTLINDDSVSPDERAAACTALGTSCIIADVEMEDMIECLNTLKTAFSKKIPNNDQFHSAFANALTAWCLILSVADDSIACEQIQNCMGVLCKLLELGSLNLRIAAGEAAALVYELAYNNRMSLQGPVNTLHNLLQEFANESGRHKGKREKKQQKSSFRDILKSVKGNIHPEQTIKFGPEFIEIGSWSWLLRYRAFKDALGPGTNIHLQTNPFVRETFDLGLPLPKELKESKVSKYEKQLVNSASSKVRTQKRNQRRDHKHKASGL